MYWHNFFRTTFILVILMQVWHNSLPKGRLFFWLVYPCIPKTNSPIPVGASISVHTALCCPCRFLSTSSIHTHASHLLYPQTVTLTYVRILTKAEICSLGSVLQHKSLQIQSELSYYIYYMPSAQSLILTD